MYEYDEWEYRPVYGIYSRRVYRVFYKGSKNEFSRFVKNEYMSKKESFEMRMSS